MSDLADVIRALHQNARQQTSVAFNPAFTEEERAREMRRLRKAARDLDKQRALLRRPEDRRAQTAGLEAHDA